MKRLVRITLVGFALFAAACGQNPEATERARGILTGPNLVLALSVLFIVIAGGALFAAVGLDRFVRSRNQLATAPAEAEEVEEEDEVVAGITVGRAGVPRWLYGFYVLIPAFAFLYVVNNVALRPAAEEAPETQAPSGPRPEWTIVASGIAFDLDTMQFPAGEEITVTMDNRDAGVPHDWTLWESEEAATANDAGAKIAATNNITGANEADVTFPAPEPGEYFFNCTVHPPSMQGTVEVVEG